MRLNCFTLFGCFFHVPFRMQETSDHHSGIELPTALRGAVAAMK
ncbi:MAG: hypothetical protein JWN23_2112 [Rhodocyclales bacterium]|nr:hypothetical protein [Rhodocyclales bacterium]